MLLLSVRASSLFLPLLLSLLPSTVLRSPVSHSHTHSLLHSPCVAFLFYCIHIYIIILHEKRGEETRNDSHNNTKRREGEESKWPLFLKEEGDPHPDNRHPFDALMQEFHCFLKTVSYSSHCFYFKCISIVLSFC